MALVNYIAFLVMAAAGCLVGAVWYGILGRQWMAALGWTEADRARYSHRTVRLT